MIKPPPIQQPISDNRGLFTVQWVKWLESIKLGVNSKADLVGSEDIEITDSAKGIILKSPDGTRWRVTVSNAGALVVTAI